MDRAERPQPKGERPPQKAPPKPAEAKAGHNQPPEETPKLNLKKRPEDQPGAQAVRAGVFGRILGERLPRRAWIGTAICLGGVLMVTGVDASLDARALGGDLLALAGGVFGGAYIVTGGFARRELSTVAYTSLCYGVCGVILLVVCVVTGNALAGYSIGAWVRIAALMLTGQLLAHSLMNFVLRSISPTIVSLATLFTVPGATLIAAATLGVTPPIETVPAMALLLAGTAIVISARERAPAETP